MINNKIKNNIYAIISISTLSIIIISFIFSINFLIKVNKASSEIDINIIKENTVILDLQRYDKMKNYLN